LPKQEGILPVIRRLKYRRHTLGLLGAALIIFGVLIAFAPLTNINFWGIDLYTFRAAAKALAWGANPYDEPNILRFADGAKVGNIHNYLYAPYFAFALRPLIWLSPEAASRVWFLLNLVLFFASVGLLLRALRWSPKPAAFLALMAGLILFPPLRTTLIIGQSTILLVFCLALSLFLWRRGHPWISGFVFSLGLFKPHLFPLLLFFIFYRQWRWLLGAGLGLALLNLPLFGWLANWFIAATTVRAANLAVDQCFQMVSGVSLLNCTLAWPGGLNVVLLSIISLILLLSVWRSARLNFWQTDEAAFDRLLAIFMTLSLLLIDHTRVADQMLLVFPLLVVWRDWFSLGRGLARRAGLFLMLSVYVIPYSLDVLGSKNIAFRLPFWYLGLSIAVLALLVLEWVRSYEDAAV
jgi:hypothetical protein